MYPKMTHFGVCESQKNWNKKAAHHCTSYTIYIPQRGERA